MSPTATASRPLTAEGTLPPGRVETAKDKVTFIFNFFDELRRIAPPTRR